MKSPGEKIRIGVLGCSDIARRKFIPALAKSRFAELAAVSSRDRDKADSFASAYDCQSLTNEQLVASAEIDLVYLSLPNDLHEAWGIHVLEAGKHLICEKPLATSLSAAKKMLAAAAHHHRLLYENQMFLFHPQHAVVKTLVDNGAIGRLRSLRCSFGFPSPAEGGFRLHPQQGGGAFHDLARYPVGTALYFLKGTLGEFRGHALWENSLNVAVHGTAVTDARESFSFSIAFGQQYEAFYEIIGEAGKLLLERAFTTPADHRNTIVLTTGATVSTIPVPPADHFLLMIDTIAHTILSGGDYAPLHRQALLVARLADLLRLGCMEGHREQR